MNGNVRIVACQCPFEGSQRLIIFTVSPTDSFIPFRIPLIAMVKGKPFVHICYIGLFAISGYESCAILLACPFSEGLDGRYPFTSINEPTLNPCLASFSLHTAILLMAFRNFSRVNAIASYRTRTYDFPQ